MQDINLKEWLNLSGIPFEDTQWLETPTTEAYGVYIDKQHKRGSDTKLHIVEHDLEVEVYTEFADRDILDKVETLFIDKGLEIDTIPFTYIESERLFMSKIYCYYTTKLRRN